MDWPPNYHALSSLIQIKNLYKLLTVKYNRRHIWVIKNLLCFRLSFKGFVNNFDTLSNYDYFINPVRIGGGIRTKNEYILSNKY